MSWSFQLQKVNQSFEHIASWYQEFMHRTETYFRRLNERLMRLEDRAWQAPSDEQVERVLRKILAERFSGGQEPSSTVKEEAPFVEDRKNLINLRPIRIDPAMLFVHPNDVPSRAYVETMDQLNKQLETFPSIENNTTVE